MHSYMRGTAIAADTDDKLVHLLPHTDVSCCVYRSTADISQANKDNTAFSVQRTKAGMLFIEGSFQNTAAPAARREDKEGVREGEGKRKTRVWRGGGARRGMAKHGPDTAHSHLSKPWHGASGNGGGWVNKKTTTSKSKVMGHR